ncbi:MAG: ABC transporter permease [gamma proteobacterium symbiont of Taylorina sp.]|nr:ABC transporter permease [gamma proteobacterium symbiont of Taylorina sp.]
MKKNIKVYTPDAMTNKGLSVWYNMFLELWGSRDLIWRLIQRDISVRYRQSVLGYVWAVLPQIATVALFTYLSSHRVFDMGQTQMPYVIHALWSLSVWQLFSTCLIGCTNSLVNAGTLVTKINFPKEALVVVAIGQSVFDFLIRLIPLVVVMLWYGFLPSWNTLLIPFVLFFVILLALGVGFIFSIITLVLRDVGNAVNIVLTFGMFLSPILYPPPVREPFSLINTYNPFSPLLIATQDLLSGNVLLYLNALWLMIALSVVVFLMGWRIFHITMPRIVERA